MERKNKDRVSFVRRLKYVYSELCRQEAKGDFQRLDGFFKVVDSFQVHCKKKGVLRNEKRFEHLQPVANPPKLFITYS